MEDHVDVWMEVVALFASDQTILLTVKDGVVVVMRQADMDLERGVGGGDNQLSLQPGEFRQLLEEVVRDHTKKEEHNESPDGPAVSTGENTVQQGHYKCTLHHYYVNDSGTMNIHHGS